MATRVGVSDDSAKRIGKAVRFVERRPRGGFPGERYSANGLIIPAKPCIIGAAGIVAGSLTSPSSGTVTIYDWVQGAGAPSSQGTVTAYNFYNAALTAGKLAWVVWFAGRWCVVTVGC